MRGTTAIGMLATVAVLSGAATASVCPPDADGTRTLAVSGKVLGYALEGSRIRVVIGRNGCREMSTWQPNAGAPVQAALPLRVQCHGARLASALGHDVLVNRAPPRQLVARHGKIRALLGRDDVIRVFGTNTPRQFRRSSDAPAVKLDIGRDRVLVLAAGTREPDRPYRLEGYSMRTGRALFDWPLLGPPATLDVYDRYALFSSRNAGGLFVMRLTDGRTTNLGPVRPWDRPQIGPHGVVFQSNRNKRDYHLHRERVAMKFIPITTLREELQRTGDQVVRPWPAKALAMDGARVAVVLDAPGAACDAVGFWNVPRHWFVRVNMVEDLTCSRGMAVGSDLAIAGIGAGWIGRRGDTAESFFSDTTACVEEVAGSALDGRTPVAGDGQLLAFGGLRSGSRAGAIGLVNWKTERKTLIPASSAVRALSVDDTRTAILRADGIVDVLASSGRRIASVTPTAPRAIALRGNTVAVLTRRGTLETWSLLTQRRETTWSTPAGALPAVDLHHGIAVFGTAQDVYAMRVDTGRLTRLATVPTRPRVQIESPGVVYQVNIGGHAVLRFLRLARVERSLGLR